MQCFSWILTFYAWVSKKFASICCEIGAIKIYGVKFTAANFGNVWEAMWVCFDNGAVSDQSPAVKALIINRGRHYTEYWSNFAQEYT